MAIYLPRMYFAQDAIFDGHPAILKSWMAIKVAAYRSRRVWGTLRINMVHCSLYRCKRCCSTLDTQQSCRWLPFTSPPAECTLPWLRSATEVVQRLGCTSGVGCDAWAAAAFSAACLWAASRSRSGLRRICSSINRLRAEMGGQFRMRTRSPLRSSTETDESGWEKIRKQRAYHFSRRVQDIFWCAQDAGGE